MAFAVDTAGKVTANPRTGKINNSAVSSIAKRVEAGISDANSASNGANGLRTADKKQAKNQLHDVTTDAMGTDLSNAIESVARKAINTIASSPREVTPTKVQTSGMTRPLDVSGRSYWDDMIDDGWNVSEQGVNKTPKVDSLSPRFDAEQSQSNLNRWGEEYKENPGNTFFGAIGNTRSNDKWENLFASGFNGELEPMSDEELERLHSYSGNNLFEHDGALIPYGTGVVDDGTMDYEHLTSPKVLGEQLQRYARNGMVFGLDADEIERIEPDRIYDKTQLALDHENYGLIPYIPDQRTWLDTIASGTVNSIGNVFGSLANLRSGIASAINPYGIKFNNGSETRNINGSEFDKYANGYINNVMHTRKYNPERLFDDSHKNGGSWTQYATSWKTVNPSGEEEVHYGKPGDFQPNNDGTWTIEYSDGTTNVIGDEEFNHYYGRDIDGIEYNQDGTWSISFADGTTETMLDEDVQNYYGRDIVDYASNGDGTWSLPFSDGTVAVMTESYIRSLPTGENGNPEIETDIVDISDMGMDTLALNGGVVPSISPDDNGEARDVLSGGEAYSFWLPNYVMDDGTVLSFDDALTLLSDQGNGKNANLKDGQSIEYDFDSLIPYVPIPISNKPQRLEGTPLSIDDDGNIDFSRFFDDGVDRVFDWTMGSAPIMIGSTAWPVSIANGLQDLRYGIASDSYDPSSGTYNYIRGERDKNGTIRPSESTFERLLSAELAAGVPRTEEMVGPIGDGPGGKWLADTVFDKPGLRSAFIRWLLGSNAEGFEEIGGNIFDEFRDQGMYKAFGPYLDDRGNIVATEAEAAKDATGKPRRQAFDADQPWWPQISDRLYNAGVPMLGRESGLFQPDALANNVNGYVGGFAISALPTAVQEAGEMGRYSTEDAILSDMGLDRYNDPKGIRRRRAPERYLEQWR
jgi:hypothetical protein